jgi:hypothetical protein
MKSSTAILNKAVSHPDLKIKFMDEDIQFVIHEYNDNLGIFFLSNQDMTLPDIP